MQARFHASDEPIACDRGLIYTQASSSFEIKGGKIAVAIATWFSPTHSSTHQLEGFF